MASAESQLEELVCVLEEAQALLDRHGDMDQVGDDMVQLRTWAGIDAPQ